jgi:hypothetical protein
VPGKRINSSSPKGRQHASGGAHASQPLADLYRVAASEQLRRLEQEPTLNYDIKLTTLYSVLNDLIASIDRISRPAPEKAPELWAQRDPRSTEDVNSFIARIYGPYASRGMTMANLLHLDRQAYYSWYAWRRLAKNKDVPPPLITKYQATDQALAELGGSVSLAGLTEQLPAAIRNLIRLQRTAAKRRRTAKGLTGPSR